MGRSIAKPFPERGISLLVLCDSQYLHDALIRFKNETRTLWPDCQIEVLAIDTKKEASVRTAMDSVHQKEGFGRIDYCIHCTGISRKGRDDCYTLRYEPSSPAASHTSSLMCLALGWNR